MGVVEEEQALGVAVGVMGLGDRGLDCVAAYGSDQGNSEEQSQREGGCRWVRCSHYYKYIYINEHESKI